MAWLAPIGRPKRGARGVLDRLLEAGVGAADGQGGDGDAAVVEDGEVPEPGAGLTQQVVRGTRQPSSASPCVSLACQPSFRYAGSTTRPGVPASMTNDEMSSPIRAVTVMIDVIGVPQFVMKAFAPSSTQSSPSRRARGRWHRRRCHRPAH